MSENESASSESEAVTEVKDQVLQVVKGNPSDQEVAALVTVLAGVSGGVSSADLEPQERDLWGHPVDKLRYSVFSWQRITKVERLHVRR